MRLSFMKLIAVLVVSVSLLTGGRVSGADESGCSVPCPMWKAASGKTGPADCPQARIAAAAKMEWTSLFNGKDLEGWEVTGKKDAFSVRDGVIECNGGGGGWIKSNEEYENFILEMDYKISKNGNSGTFVRATREGNPAFTGMEIQIQDDYGKDPTVHTAGSIYGSICPMVNMIKPAGEWNHVRISCVDRDLQVYLNGVKVVHVNLDEHPSLKDRAKTGFIGMQDHGNYAWFRDIRIKNGI